MARKLWLASVIQGHRNPFGKPLTEYTVPQLDFVLEMASIDEPDSWRFVRAGADGTPKSAAMAQWNDALTGAARNVLMAATGFAQAIGGIAAWRSRHAPGAGMRLGLTRGGKRIDDVKAD